MPSPGSVLTARPRARRAFGLTASLLLVGGVLAGCGGEEEPSAEPSTTSSASPSASSSPSQSPSQTPSQTPSASQSASQEPTATDGPTPDPGGGSLQDALLTAAEVPGLNDESSWTQGRTGPVGQATFGWCSRVDAPTVGASEGVERQFVSDQASDRAGQQVLDVVDETNARRVEQTFRGWHRDCQGRDGARVGAIEQLSVPGAEAWWYLSSRSAGDGQWEAFGLARAGGRVTLLRMQHAGQDHSYEPGQDPLERALRTAAGKLG